MYKSSSLMLLPLSFLVGCGSQSPPATSKPAPAFVWSLKGRPYQVLGVSASNVPRLGDQSRNAEAVFPNPQKRAEVEEALREIYDELKKDIEKVQRDAEYRRISILIYDSEGDEKYDPDAYLCHLQVAPDPGDSLPEWPADAVDWQWRDPEARPDARTRKIEWEYIDVLNDINGSTEFPMSRPADATAAEYRDSLESTYQPESEELKRQLAEKHKLSVEELEELLDRVLKWKYEGASWSED